jgi:hypothetical protein
MLRRLRRRERRYVFASLFPLLLLVRPVHAAPQAAPSAVPSSSDGAPAVRLSSEREFSEDPIVDQARTHFLRGVDLYRAGAYDVALAEFTRAYDSAPNFRILYNLGQIQAQRHEYVASLELFRRYLSDGAGQISEERVGEVQTEITELERRVAQLHVSTNVDDARLFVDDMPVAELPLAKPILVNAGIHRLRVEKVGRAPAFRTVTLTGGDTLDLALDLDSTVDLEASPEPAPFVQPSPPKIPEPDTTPFWMSLAATGVLTGATATFALLTHQANAELGRQLDQYPAPRAAIERSRERVRTYAVTTDALGIASALAAGITTYFYFSTATEHEPEPGVQLQLEAQVGPARAGLSCVGKF